LAPTRGRYRKIRITYIDRSNAARFQSLFRLQKHEPSFFLRRDDG
jgi:hypothetical protein